MATQRTQSKKTTAASKTNKPRPCRCYVRVEKILAEHYPHIKLDPVFVLGRRRTETCFRISTVKEKGSRRSNIAITPSYCPFCGVRTAREGEGLLAAFDGTIKKRATLK